MLRRRPPLPTLNVSRPKGRRLQPGYLPDWPETLRARGQEQPCYRALANLTRQDGITPHGLRHGIHRKVRITPILPHRFDVANLSSLFTPPHALPAAENCKKHPRP